MLLQKYIQKQEIVNDTTLTAEISKTTITGDKELQQCVTRHLLISVFMFVFCSRSPFMAIKIGRTLPVPFPAYIKLYYGNVYFQPTSQEN